MSNIVTDYKPTTLKFKVWRVSSKNPSGSNPTGLELP